MMAAALEQAVRTAGPRIVAALAAWLRDLDVAEEAFAEACAKAAETWDTTPPDRADAWLYRTAQRVALDRLRHSKVRLRHAEQLIHLSEAEEEPVDDKLFIPDERLRLIFVCCHPAIAEDARAALTLRTVCGLSTGEIARAFLLPEPTLAQRLVRAKRKIAEAGVPFEVPGPQLWAERLSAVLSTVEIAYAKAHEDAAGSGPHAGFGPEMLALGRLLARLLPDEPDVLATAATICFAEARRPARTDAQGRMVPLAEQDPDLWNGALIAEGDAFLKRGLAMRPCGMRLLRAALHAVWCQRRSLADPPPWPKVLKLYDGLLELRDDPLTRLNRAVALAEVDGLEIALAEVERLKGPRVHDYLPFHATHADLLRRAGRSEEARAAYARALELGPSPAERQWLEDRIPSF